MNKLLCKHFSSFISQTAQRLIFLKAFPRLFSYFSQQQHKKYKISQFFIFYLRVKEEEEKSIHIYSATIFLLSYYFPFFCLGMSLSGANKQMAPPTIIDCHKTS